MGFVNRGGDGVAVRDRKVARSNVPANRGRSLVVVRGPFVIAL